MGDNKKFWSTYAGIYEKVTRGSRKSEEVYREMEENICRYLNKDMVVLELAAGPAIMSKKISQSCKKLISTDFSEEMINKAKGKDMPSNVTFEVADATNLNYEDNTFDAIVIANALHIMPDPDKAISEIKRALKKNGVIIAPTFTLENSIKSKLTKKFMELFGFRNFSNWTNESYKKYMKNQNLKIEEEKIITGHNFPITFLVCKVII